jgi:hypothetical protein
VKTSHHSPSEIRSHLPKSSPLRLESTSQDRWVVKGDVPPEDGHVVKLAVPSPWETCAEVLQNEENVASESASLDRVAEVLNEGSLYFVAIDPEISTHLPHEGEYDPGLNEKPWRDHDEAMRACACRNLCPCSKYMR